MFVQTTRTTILSALLLPWVVLAVGTDSDHPLLVSDSDILTDLQLMPTDSEMLIHDIDNEQTPILQIDHDPGTGESVFQRDTTLLDVPSVIWMTIAYMAYQYVIAVYRNPYSVLDQSIMFFSLAALLVCVALYQRRIALDLPSRPLHAVICSLLTVFVATFVFKLSACLPYALQVLAWAFSAGLVVPEFYALLHRNLD